VELTKLGVDVIENLSSWVSIAVSKRVDDRLQQWQAECPLLGVETRQGQFSCCDKLVAEKAAKGFGSSDVVVQGFITPQGKKVLLVNKTNSEKNGHAQFGFAKCCLADGG